MLDSLLTSAEIQALGGQTIVKVTFDVYITRLTTVVAFTLIFYDCLLTLPDEVQFLWPRRWTSIKIITQLNRFLSIVFISFSMFSLVALTGPLSNKGCEAAIFSSGWAAYFSFLMCNWILLARTKAVLGHTPIVNHLLLASYIISYSITAGLMAYSYIKLTGHIFYAPSSKMCAIPIRPSTMGYIWLPPMVFETTTFILTIRKLYHNALEEYTLGSKLLGTLYRDGVCYYLVIIGLRLFNMLSWMIMPISVSLIGVYLLWAVMSISTIRLQINLIEAASPLCRDSAFGPSGVIFNFPTQSHSSQPARIQRRSNYGQRTTISSNLVQETYSQRNYRRATLSP